MIINKNIYECPKCKKWYFFDTSKPYDSVCIVCNCELTYLDNADCDTELAEERKSMSPYDPTKDSDSPYYIPVVHCPYCNSTNTKKISGTSKVVSVGLFGLASSKVGKQWHCNKCSSDF